LLNTALRHRSARSGPTPIVARASIAAIGGGTVLAVIGSWGAGLLLTAMAAATTAAAIDVTSGRIPDRLVIATSIPLLMIAASEFAAGRAGVAAGLLLGALAIGSPVVVVHLAVPAAMGFGDVKLGAVVGAAVGLVDARFGLVALSVAAGSTAVVGLGAGRRDLPFGPGLVVGGVSAFVLAISFEGAPTWL
jgi:leader peptidase (prepilin peptidase)/N-methyltransferase